MKQDFDMRYLIFPLILILLMGCTLSTSKSRLYGGIYFTDQGGFEIQKINNYTFKEYPRGFEMMSQDADPFVGPGFQGYGGLLEQERSTQELWEFLTQEEYNDLEFNRPKNRKIDGYTGLIAEFDGVRENTKIKGKLFAVMFDQNQQFYLIGFAPEDEYRKFESLYDMTLKTVKFYIPNRVIKFQNPYKRNIGEGELNKTQVPGISTEPAP